MGNQGRDEEECVGVWCRVLVGWRVTWRRVNSKQRETTKSSKAKPEIWPQRLSACCNRCAPQGKGDVSGDRVKIKGDNKSEEGMTSQRGVTSMGGGDKSEGGGGINWGRDNSGG